MNFIDSHINLISLIGTIVGIIGLFISIATLIQTSNITNVLNQKKFENEFKSKCRILLINISRLKKQINDDEVNQNIISEVITNVQDINMYCDKMKWGFCKKSKIIIILFKSKRSFKKNNNNEKLKNNMILNLSILQSILKEEATLYDANLKEEKTENSCYKL